MRFRPNVKATCGITKGSRIDFCANRRILLDRFVSICSQIMQVIRDRPAAPKPMIAEFVMASTKLGVKLSHVRSVRRSGKMDGKLHLHENDQISRSSKLKIPKPAIMTVLMATHAAARGIP